MNKNLIILGICFFIFGCATEAKYQNILNTWVGSSELNLVRSWGAPVNSYEAGGRKFVVYSSSRNIVMPGSQPTYTTTYVGNTAYTNSYGGRDATNISMSCVTTFEIENDRVVTWSYKGNDCTAM